MVLEKYTPDAKEARHNTFTKYWYIFSSAVLSFFFIAVMFISAVLHRLSLTGKTKEGLPAEDSEAEQCYPDIANMKLLADLRYYALQMGLDLLEYTIQTKDGYILSLQRLIDPKHTDEQRAGMQPVLCQHGLLSSSGSYLTPGQRSIPVFLLRQGYDVWLGNNRSGFEPKHAFYEGNLMHNEAYWDWDVKDLAYYDLTCLIDNVLSHTPNFKKLILIGHLQGCTQSFLMLTNPEMGQYQQKIEYFVALAPAIFPGVLFHKRKFLKFMGNRSPTGFQLFFGICCFLNNLTQTRNGIYNWPIFGLACVLMFNYLFLWYGTRWNQNRKIWNFHFIFNVSYVSAKLMTWWVSLWRPDSFANQLVSKEAFEKGFNHIITEDPKYNIDDSKSFFPFKQTWFKDTIVPMIIFNGEIDDLVDGKRLSSHMTNFEPQYTLNDNLHTFQLEGYSHLDVLWADDVVAQIGEKVLQIIKS